MTQRFHRTVDRLVIARFGFNSATDRPKTRTTRRTGVRLGVQTSIVQIIVFPSAFIALVEREHRRPLTIVRNRFNH